MADSVPSSDNLRPEYDDSVFQSAVRGKYAERFQNGTNLVKIDPDLSQSFPDSKAVNDALRLLQRVATDTKSVPHLHE